MPRLAAPPTHHPWPPLPLQLEPRFNLGTESLSAGVTWKVDDENKLRAIFDMGSNEGTLTWTNTGSLGERRAVPGRACLTGRGAGAARAIDGRAERMAEAGAGGCACAREPAARQGGRAVLGSGQVTAGTKQRDKESPALPHPYTAHPHTPPRLWCLQAAAATCA